MIFFVLFLFTIPSKKQNKKVTSVYICHLGVKKSGHTEDTAVGVRCGKGGKRPGEVEGGLYFHEKAMKAPSFPSHFACVLLRVPGEVRPK